MGEKPFKIHQEVIGKSFYCVFRHIDNNYFNSTCLNLFIQKIGSGPATK